MEQFKSVEGGWVQSTAIENVERAHEEALSKDQAFEKLLKIADALKEMGFEVEEASLTREALDNDETPLAEYGDIRFGWNKRNGLKIWFTNGMEEPDNPKRVAINSKLSELGLN